MKYAIKEYVGTIGTLQKKSTEVSQNITEDTEMLLVEHPLTETPEGVMLANTCTGIKTFLLNEKLNKAVVKQLKLSPDKPKTLLYGFFNGEKFSDMLEFATSRKFMNHEVGIDSGFLITGGGHNVSCDIEQALPQMKELKKFLKQIFYRGEITIGVSSSALITDFYCGHNPMLFASYVEIHKLNLDKEAPVVSHILNFIKGEENSCQLFKSFVLFNVVSKAPFPHGILTNQNFTEITIPKSAERHVWKTRVLRTEIAVVLSHANDVRTAQYRIKNSIKNMLSYDADLQYRTDYGRNLSFVLSEEIHQAFSEDRGEQKGRKSHEHIEVLPENNSSHEETRSETIPFHQE